MKPLPVGEFEWLDDVDDLTEFVKNNYEDWNLTQQYGYLIECDLSYPAAIQKSNAHRYAYSILLN